MSRAGRSLRIFNWSRRYYGIRATCRAIQNRILGRRAAYQDAHQLLELQQSFDSRHNVATTTDISDDQLGLTAAEYGSSMGYEPTTAYGFGMTLEDLPVDYSQFTFVDYGAGMGRAMLMASDFPFQKIVGVELSQQLVETCRQNLERYRSKWQLCHQFEVHHANATHFVPPLGPLVVYLFNPFTADVLLTVLENLRQSIIESPRPLYLVYANPRCRELIDQADWLQQVDGCGFDESFVVYHA